MKGSRQDPITVEDHHLNRAWKWCRCCDCGEAKQCTPDMDFWYPCAEDPDHQPRLLCDGCHDEFLRSLGMKVIDVRPSDRQRMEGTQN